MRKAITAAAIVLTLALSACGGGSEPQTFSEAYYSMTYEQMVEACEAPDLVAYVEEVTGGDWDEWGKQPVSEMLADTRTIMATCP